MRGKNRCEWLLVGRTVLCGTSCMEKFCSAHRKQLRKNPGTEPKPCYRCGKGTKTKTYLCGRCSADSAKRHFSKVMQELQRHSDSQRKCPFIGLREKSNTTNAGGSSPLIYKPLNAQTSNCETRDGIKQTVIIPWPVCRCVNETKPEVVSGTFP